MATIEELDFKLIVHDEEFKTKIESITKMAQDLNTSVSNLMNISGKIGLVTDEDVKNAKNANQIIQSNVTQREREARAIQKTAEAQRLINDTHNQRVLAEEEKLRQQISREAIRTATAQERLNQLQERGRKSLLDSSKLWKQIGGLAATYFSAAGAMRLVKNLVQVSAEFELQKTTLGAILGDVQKANELYEQMKDLAVESPFAFKDLTTYAKQLSAYSIPVNELYDTTKMLADVSAGLGVGMDRLVLAYGQIRSASFLRGQEVRQLTEAGIPILEELRKQFVALGEEGITVGDVFDKISKRMVPFEMVEKVFKDMTSEGGKFYQMQEVQAETLKGKISNLTDAYQIMFSEIGDRKSGALKGAVDLARSLAENYEKVGRAIVELVAAFGAYKAALLVTKVLEEASLIASINKTKKVKELGKAINILTSESKAYAAAQNAIPNPYVLIAAAVAALAAHFISAAVQAAKFKKELEGIADAQMNTASKSADEFSRLVNMLKNATEGSQKYRNAIEELNRKYSEYLPNLLTEKNALDEIRKAEDEVTNAIYARARAYAETNGLQKIEDRYGDSMNKQVKALREMLNVGGLGAEMVEDIIKGFRDAVSKESAGGNKFEFEQTLRNYLGDSYSDFTTDVGTKWSELEQAANRYADTVKDVAKAERDYANTLEVRFGSGGYSSAAERLAIDPIKQKYAQEEIRILNEKMSKEETDAAILENNLAKLHAIKQAYIDLNKEADTVGKNGAWNDQIKKVQEQIDALQPKENSWLQKVVNPLINGEGMNDLRVLEADQYDDYVDKLRKEYKSVGESFKDANATYNKFVEDKRKGIAVDDAVLQKTKDQSDYLEERKEIIETIGKALGISLSTTKRATGTSGKSEAQTNLEMMRDTLKDIMSWYDQLKDAGMTDSMAQSYLKQFFPDYSDTIDALNFRDALLDVADALEEYDEKAAQALRDDVSGNNLKQIKENFIKSKKALEDYEDLLYEWSDMGQLEGKGVSFDVRKIVVDYDKAIRDIEKKRADALKELDKIAEDSGMNRIEYEVAVKTINDSADIQKANKLAEAQERAREAVKKYYEEWRNGHLDFDNLADKSINELNDMIEAIENFDTTGMDSKTLADLDALKLSLQEITGIIDKAKNEDTDKLLGNITDEQLKKAKNIASNIKELASTIKEFAVASKNSGLEKFASSVESMAGSFKNIMQGFKEGGKVGGAVAIVTSIANMTLQAATKAAELKSELEDIAREQYFKTITDSIENASTIFGDSWLREINSIGNGIKGLRSSIDSIVSYASKKNLFTGEKHAALSVWLKNYADQLGMQLTNADGTYVSSTLEAIMAKYGDNLRNVGYKEFLEDLIEYNNELIDSMARLDESMTAMFGHLGESITDEIINNLWAVGDAVVDLEGIFGDLGNSIFKSLVQSIVVDDILSKFRGELEKIWTDDSLSEEDIAQKIADFADGVASGLEDSNEKILALFDAFQERDIITNEAEGKADTLANGIKGITEDTANLLASYVNAIRADVAYNRMQLEQLLGLLPQTPTLADYLMQIQANTFNTAEHTRVLMENINSVMTVSDGPAIRVFM